MTKKLIGSNARMILTILINKLLHDKTVEVFTAMYNDYCVILTAGILT